MTKRTGLFSKVKQELIRANQEAKLLRLSLSDTFSGEIEAVRGLLASHPFLSVSFAFVIGLVFGGLLQARVSRFTLLSLLGGFPLAIVYGQSQGLPTLLSIGIVIMIDSFVSYSLLKLLRILDEYPRFHPYLNKVKVRYADSSKRFMTYSGRLGVQGALAVCTFLIGWWITTVIAYILDLDTNTAMVSIFSGLLAVGLLSLAIFEGFVRLIPDPVIVVLIFLFVFIITGLVMGRIFKRISHAHYL
jgi:hypothetical protein